MGYNPRGCKELDKTEQLSLSLLFYSYSYLWNLKLYRISLLVLSGDTLPCALLLFPKNTLEKKKKNAEKLFPGNGASLGCGSEG